MSEIVERQFRVQYGRVGGENHSSHYGPIYKVRRAAMAVAQAAAKNYQKAGDEATAAKCADIREALLYPTGSVLDGLCVKYIAGEQVFYIAIVPPNVSWETASMTVVEPGPHYFAGEFARRPASVPVLGTTLREFPDARRVRAPEPVNPAAMIADKMAKAGRKAVEGNAD